jgi:hypothetical protein
MYFEVVNMEHKLNQNKQKEGNNKDKKQKSMK